VAFRCNYPQSRTVAGFLRGRDGQDMSAALEQLVVGQAYVSTPEQAAARKVFMAKDDDEKARSARPDPPDREAYPGGSAASGTPSVQVDGSIHYGDGRTGVPNPSPGHLIVSRTGTTAHFSAGCQDLRNKDRVGWKTFPDPERTLWRDILVVAPITDEAKRAQFARSIGLVNDAGKPVLWVCERCVLRVPRRR
jgi:hypothetical protein